MRFLFVIGLLMMLQWPSSLQACGDCGCVVGGMNGLFPQQRQNILGLQWNWSRYRLLDEAGQTMAQEHYHTTALQLRYFVHPRWQIQANIPYVFQQQQATDGSQLLQQGLSDARLQVGFSLIDAPLDTFDNGMHRLVLLAGVKAPTGEAPLEYRPEHLTFERGTSSWDATLGLRYLLRYRSWGMQAEGSWQINSMGRNGYQYGNRLTGQLLSFYTWRKGRWSFFPHAGLQWEQLGDTWQQSGFSSAKFELPDTGGSATFAIVGWQTTYKNWNFGISYQQPLDAARFNEAAQAQGRLLVQGNYLF